MHWLGISLRHDAVERRNIAAVYAWSGTLLGVTAVYAGGDIGEGPSLWNNVFSATLGTMAMIVLWLLLEFLSGISHLVTVERDSASGARLGGAMLAVGIIFGRALAGDWQSESHTLNDFVRQGWFAVPVVMAAALVDIATAPSPQKVKPGCFVCGVLPVALYLGVALWWLTRLGIWK
jgi:uncharacterized membrane protein YjfL (UPF0719 family)